MKKCLKCSSDFSEDAKFCEKCGEIHLFEKDTMITDSHNDSSLALNIFKVLMSIVIIGVVASVILHSPKTSQEKVIKLNDKNKWITYNTITDKFSIFVPDYPTSEIGNGTTNDGIEFEYHTYLVNKDPEYFLVAKYIYSKPIDVSKPDNLLERSMNGFIVGSGGTLDNSSFSYYKSYRSLDFLSKTLNVSFQGRIILVGQDIYFLNVAYPNNINIDNVEYQNFINSLEFN